MFKLKESITFILIITEAVLSKPLFKWKDYKEGYVYGRPEQIHISYGTRPDQMVIIFILIYYMISNFNKLKCCLFAFISCI
jgi:hypothetical protein